MVDLEGGGFVIADIPGLIEGASQGVGLGHEFLRHIERTKVLIHIIDGAGVEGRDPVEDIRAINAELEAYNPDLMKRPQVIAANKMDTLPEEDREEMVQLIREEYGTDIPIFPISAATGEGVKELLYYVRDLLKTVDPEPIVFEKEFEYTVNSNANLPYTVEHTGDHEYTVEGPRIEKMLGYTNLDTERGFAFFQQFLKTSGILDDLEAAGIEEGDTVRMYELAFDYYKE